jgi:quinol monooxygenase YgiN
MIVIQGHLDIDPSDRDAAIALMIAVHDASEAEDGCVTYRFAEELGRPGRFWLIEAWESEEALAAHFKTPHMASFRAGLGELLVTDRALFKHEVTSRGPL